MFTRTRSIRSAFWALHPQFSRRERIRAHDGKGLMYPTDTRCAFADFLDALHRAGSISDRLAQSATLED